jgi:hypothetical protein
MVQCAWKVEQLCKSRDGRGQSLRRSDMLFQEVHRKLLMRGVSDDSSLSLQDVAASTAAWTTSPSMWLDRAQYHHGNKDFIVAVRPGSTFTLFVPQ